MTALGVFHHGDPDWYYDLDPRKQTAVNAVLDLLEGEDDMRLSLPIPMTALLFGELKERKLTRTRTPTAPAPRRAITVVDAGRRRPATADEEQMLAGAADAMTRRALLANGWSEKSIGFWFQPDEPADLAREARRKREQRGGA